VRVDTLLRDATEASTGRDNEALWQDD